MNQFNIFKSLLVKMFNHLNLFNFGFEAKFYRLK